MYVQSVGAVIGYFKAQLKIMCVIYVVLLAGLLLMRVKYAGVIGIGIAFVDMLPIFGTGTVLIPWAIIKVLSGDYVMCIGPLILSMAAFVVHQVIQPKMISDTVGMVIINMAKAGAFDKQIWCIKELINDFNQFRKIEAVDKSENG